MILPRPARASFVTALLAFALSWLASPAVAQAEDRKTLIEHGKAQRLVGDETAALALFQRAHKLGATPESFGLMGASELNLNRTVEAEQHLTEALKVPRDPFVQKNGQKLAQMLAVAKSLLGWIEVVGTPAGAEVEVAGRPSGRLPLPGPIRVVAGEVNVRLAAPGYKVARRDVEVAIDQVSRVNIDLEAQPNAGFAARAPVKPARRGGIDIEPPPGSDVIEATPPPAGPSTYRTAGWITAGAGVVLLGAGIAALVVKESNTKDFNSYDRAMTGDKRCNEGAPNSGGGACPTYLDRLKAARMVAYGAFAGAGLAAIVSVILLSASDSGSGVALAPQAPRISSLACTPSLAPGNLGGACALRF